MRVCGVSAHAWGDEAAPIAAVLLARRRAERVSSAGA
jgi:hypothetical protein